MQQNGYRYITTPIYYANGDLHVGHHCSTLLANVLQAHYHHRGYETLMLTGMDEHGEKVAEAARKQGLSSQQFVDNLAERWKKQMADLGFSYDIFLRTTSPEHIANVQSVLQACYDNGDIYFGEHTGDYCVGCESFLTPSQMDENKCCLDHKRPVESRTEKNYFFKTTKYRNQIIELLKSGKLTSNTRYINELVAIAENMEGDLSISRPKTRTDWGVELPFDKDHVAYVWFDALPNYLTGLGGWKKAKESPFWGENTIHIIGKDIIRFHAIFWPAILMSLGLPMPRLLVTGMLLANNLKISKSLGNSVGLDYFGRDAFANTLLRLTNPGEDLEVSIQTVVERYNADLANGIGNLLARTLGMVEKYFDKTLPQFHAALLSADEKEMAARAEKLVDEVASDFDAGKLADALNKIWSLISATDKYISDQKPWVLAKDQTPEGKQKLENTLAQSVASLRTVGYLAAAYFPEKMHELLRSIGEDTSNLKGAFARARDYHNIRTGFQFTEIPKLYMRIELPAEEAAPQPTPKNAVKEKSQTASAAPKEKAVEGVALIGIDEFVKVDIRVGRVHLAEIVPGSDKLLHLQISLGELGTKNVFAGIRQWIKPEDIANRKLLVVANLAPRKMKFGISEGMVLATDTIDGAVSPIYVSEDLAEGARLG